MATQPQAIGGDIISQLLNDWMSYFESEKIGLERLPYKDAKENGVVGDGSTDNLAAVESAISQAISEGRKSVYLPPGTYYMSGIPTDKDKVFFIGDDAKFTGSFTARIAQVGDTIDHGDGQTHIVAGAIRYYASLGRWDLITNNDGGHHPPINIASIDSSNSSNYININFDTSAWGLGDDSDVNVSSFVIAPDEDLSRYGISCGASVNYQGASVRLWGGAYSDYIYYDGSNWVSNKGRYSLSWQGDRLLCTRTADNGRAIDSGTYPQLTARETMLMPVLGSVSAGGDTVEVLFYTTAGDVATTPNGNFKFFITDPSMKGGIEPNDIPDGLGNLWFIGVMKSKQ
ncbi:glycosyl hydrolase family 28-related protein [Tuberibacillus sp. Marseille-P3662]|uniref:glycosyl hydrolase family 28-related protein n=1 Tax=Tuberibacillus sp. Marseille-P3662 TaxID=1965358 RepID=UPI000A1C9732|nr:glycosyl hydrolase family 28-related protein [Tuberibacillus sp. Marseille-P3662]